MRRLQSDASDRWILRPPAGSGESDLTPMKADQWDKLAERLGMTVVQGRREEIANVVSAQRDASELWPLFIGLVIALGLFEMAVAKRWSAGEGN